MGSKQLLRKLIKQGTNSLTVSLPQTWLKDQQLEAKDQIVLTQLPEGLLLTKELTLLAPKKILVALSSSKKHAKIQLVNLYRAGYETIEVKYLDAQVEELVEKILEENLLGFHITKKSSQGCVLEEISNGEFQKFEVVLRRVFYLLLEVSDHIKTNNQAQVRKDVQSCTIFLNFCMRKVLTEHAHRGHSGAYVTMLNYLIDLARSYKHYVECCTKEERAVVQIEQILVQVRYLIHQVQKSFFSKDLKGLEQTAEQLHKLQYETLYSLEGIDPKVFHYCAELLRTSFYVSSSCVLILNLDHNS